MNRTLLDTDILSEVFKGVNPTVASRAAVYRQTFGRYTISTVTVMEVVAGLRRAQRPGRIQTFLNNIRGEEVLAFERDHGELAGAIAGDLERAGQTIGWADPIIAAIAIGHGLELATGNTAHYQRIQRLGYPLALVNWRV